MTMCELNEYIWVEFIISDALLLGNNCDGQHCIKISALCLLVHL